ncbi:MAG: Mor transcription activator family protein [Rhodocyclaceae bacterium]|nr:Mor transcription activator family protein [Rhodocyclaceae bacterium]
MALQIDDDYPEVLALIARTAYDWMTDKLKLEHQVASVYAFELAEEVRDVIGGSAPYIPKANSWVLSKRDREIYRRFTGDNYAQLARELDLTEMRIRQIVEKARKADISARQTPLF